MTTHWIEVKENKWKMRAAVIGFKALSGNHSGENLGRYAVGLLDRVGIMDKKSSKACLLSPSHDGNQITNSKKFLIAFISFTQQHWTTPAITTQLVRPLRISMFAEVLSGTVKNYNCRAASTTIHYFLFFIEQIYCSCLGHVVNLGNVDVMGHIMKIAAVENTTAIWEYDPTRADNRVLGGSLDVISAIRTLAIKVSIYIKLKLA